MRIDLTFTSEADDRELNAYNAAFYDLGLRWHWDSATYEGLLSLGGDGTACVRHYLQTQQPHLLRAYDVDFLVALIERKAAVHRKPADAAPGERPSRFFDWAEARGCELGA